MKNRFYITVRLIAAILIAAFLIQDIAWACPFEGYKNLAVTGLQNAETLQNLKTAMSKKLKAGSPDMAKQKDGAHFYSSLDLDITNGFIRNHIAEGRAVEVYEKEEKVVIIRRDYTNSKVPDIERHFRANGIFSKIRQSKDPALLKKILREKSNFRNLSSREQKKIIQIIQDIRLSLILGHVIVYEEPYNNTCIFGHARTGLNGYRHRLEPTIWIGEILFNRLTVKESAQLLLEEALHILKPATPHGKIDKAENSKEVIEHNEEFINSIDLSPVIRDELAASAGMGKFESPDMAKGDTEKIKGEGIEDMLLAVHGAVRSGINTTPFPEGSRVVLSSNLFEEMDMVNLERLLKGGNVEILDPKDIKRRATNNKVASDKMVIVLTKEEFKAMWKKPDERLWIRSSVLLLEDRLTGPNYLYLEGVIGLARAIMGRDKRSVATFYNMLSGMKLDEAALVCLEDNAVAFAIKAILKFKPIEADSRRLDNYKVMMETFLVSA